MSRVSEPLGPSLENGGPDLKRWFLLGFGGILILKRCGLVGFFGALALGWGFRGFEIQGFQPHHDRLEVTGRLCPGPRHVGFGHSVETSTALPKSSLFAEAAETNGNET